MSVLGIAICLMSIVSAGKYGFSRLLTKYALTSNSLAAANQAVALTPADAEAHRARAIVLDRLRLTNQGIEELETVVSLRPRDDSSWLTLGNFRDSLDDSEAALAPITRPCVLLPSTLTQTGPEAI